MMNEMSNIYVPIDSTNVKNAIPPEQEIIYSTFARLTHSSGNEYTGRGIKTTKTTWLSHLLITPKALALFVPQTNKNIACYVPLYFTGFFLKSFYTAVPDTDMSLKVSLVRIRDLEKPKAFKKRSKEFKSFLKPLKLKVHLDLVKEIYSEVQKNPYYSYMDYFLTHESPQVEVQFNLLKKNIKQFKTLDRLIEVYTKKINRF